MHLLGFTVHDTWVKTVKYFKANLCFASDSFLDQTSRQRRGWCVTTEKRASHVRHAIRDKLLQNTSPLTSWENNNNRWRHVHLRNLSQGRSTVSGRRAWPWRSCLRKRQQQCRLRRHRVLEFCWKAEVQEEEVCILYKQETRVMNFNVLYTL